MKELVLPRGNALDHSRMQQVRSTQALWAVVRPEDQAEGRILSKEELDQVLAFALELSIYPITYVHIPWQPFDPLEPRK